MEPSPSPRGAVITEEHHTGVVGLGNVGEEIEGTVVVQQEILRVALLRANNIGALDRITAEEDGLAVCQERHIVGSDIERIRS